MSFASVLDPARRAVIRATLGAKVRAEAEQADNAEKIADLVSLRALKTDNLQPEDFIRQATAWNVDPATLHALADAESAGGGFQKDGHAAGRVIIAVECHAFSDATRHAFDVSRPDVSFPEWIPASKGAPRGMERHPYQLSQDDRWGLFARQAELSIEGACSGLSVGRFQPLIGLTPAGRRQGRQEGWREMGFGSAEHMLRHLSINEFNQLEVLGRYLQVHNLMGAFRARDWRTIALGYNGSGQVEKYSAAMFEAWKRRTRTYA
jgi:hypothetical protein